MKLTAHVYLAGGETVVLSIEGDTIDKLSANGGVVYAAYDPHGTEIEALFLPDNCPNAIEWDRS